MYRVRKIVLPVLSVMFVGACSATGGRYVPVEDQSTSVHEQQQAEMVRSDANADPVVISSLPEPGAISRGQTQSPAVIALLDTADRELQAGRLEHAVASIERAINLQPKNAMLWSRLAIIRLQQQDWQQAYVLANKSNSLAQADRALLLQNWRVIEQAKAGQGDTAGVAEARRSIENLR